MPFDPNQPFEVLDEEDQASPAAPPPFDPSQPWAEVPTEDPWKDVKYTPSGNPSYIDKEGNKAVISSGGSRIYKDASGQTVELPPLRSAPFPELTDPAKLVSNAWQDVNTPLTKTLGVTPKMYESARNLIAPGAGAIDSLLNQTGVGRGLVQGRNELEQSFSSPLSLATVGAGGLIAKAPTVIQRLLSAAFAVMGAQQVGEAGATLEQAVKDKDWQTAAEAATQIVGGAGQAAMGAHGAAKASGVSGVEIERRKAASLQETEQAAKLEELAKTKEQAKVGEAARQAKETEGRLQAQSAEEMRQAGAIEAYRQSPGIPVSQPGMPLQAQVPLKFQPSTPAIPIRKAPAQRVAPAIEAQREADAQRAQQMATEPSGLSMAVEKAKQAQWGDIPANEQMLAMLPQDRPSLQPPVGAASAAPGPEGQASQTVRMAGEAVQRAQDFPAAAAEKVSQEQVPPVHPDKPLTSNQLRIMQDSIRQAVADNQIPGERKGFIAGSGLEKWADGVLHDREWLKKANTVGLDMTVEAGKRVAALAVKGTAIMERGITDFARWSAEMVKQHGDEIKPWLKKVYQQSASLRAGAFSQPEEVSNAAQERQVQGNIQPERGGTEAQRVQGESSTGDSVLRAAEGQQAPSAGEPSSQVRGGEVAPWQTVAKTPAENFSQVIKDNGFKGVTNWAYDTAARITAEDIPNLRAAREKIVQEGREAIKNGESMADGGLRAQYFSETIRMREAMDEALKSGAKTDEALGAIASDHGVQGTAENKALELKSALAKQAQSIHGGAAKDLPPEQKAIQDKNNSRSAWGDFGGLNKPKSESLPTPAIQVNGKTFTGKDHLDAYAKAKAGGQPDTSGAQEGFVDAQGRFTSREKAAVDTGLPTAKEPGKLHSSDLPEEPVGMGGAVPSEFPTDPGNPDIYGVAARVREERAKAGQVQPVEPGVGISAPDSVNRGRQLLSSGVNPEQVMSDFEQTKKLSSDDMAVARAQGEKLAQQARKIEDQYGTDSPEYKAAFKALSDWDARSKGMQTSWHATGQAQQGETDLDTGSFTGLQKQFKKDTGKEFTEPQAKAAKKVAEKSKQAADKAQEAEGKLRTFLKNVEPAPEENTLWGKVKGALTDQKKTQIVWKRIKDYIADGKDDYREVVGKVATDLGLKFDEVANIMAKNQTTKRLADDVWAKQKTARDMKEMAKRWLRNQTIPGWQKALERIPRAFFTAKTNFHGTVALGTHAPMVFFQPNYWAEYVRNFGKMYKMVGSPAYHEMQMQALLHDPNWVAARRGGLVNDPHTFEDFNNPEMAAQLGNLTGMGNRGYAVLKILRQDMFNSQWDKLPDTLKTTKMAETISDSVNHVTGVVKTKPGKGWNIGFFAPRLEMSRAAWMVGDPLRALKTFGEWGKATPEEKYFATHQVREKATVAATMFGMLALNQGMLTAMGSKQKINVTDPMKSDFLKFKIAGQNVSYGNPYITMARLPIRLGVLHYQGGTGKMAKLIYPDESMGHAVLEYARTQESPFAAFLTDIATKGDYENRPMPKMPWGAPQIPMPKRLAARGEKPYTWPEFFLEQALPIPIEEPMKDVWRHDFSMDEQHIKIYRDAFIKAMIMGGTGGRISEDTENNGSINW